MYSGQVSVTEEQLVPLVQAAKTLSIKGLVDVPVQDRVKAAETKQVAASPASPPPPVRKQTVKRPSPVSRRLLMCPAQEVSWGPRLVTRQVRRERAEQQRRECRLDNSWEWGVSPGWSSITRTLTETERKLSTGTALAWGNPTVNISPSTSIRVSTCMALWQMLADLILTGAPRLTISA